VLLVSTDCYMLLLDIYAVADGTALARETVVNAINSGTAEHAAVDCFLYGCWWDHRSYVVSRTNLHGFQGVTV
jgi:hypothetical protein